MVWNCPTYPPASCSVGISFNVAGQGIRMHHKSYMPQLDGLRAVAVLCIMWHHWAPERFDTGIPLDRAVQLFFVLSGFLITGILLDARTSAEQIGGQLRGVLKSFYARRFLRIFPLYYTVLLVACLYGVAGLPANWTWHALYASNFCFLIYPGWGTPIGHFWSLAVEEQFYLIWPVLILSVPVRTIPLALAITAVVGPAYRIAGTYFAENGIWFIGTPGSFDSLALGGILAYARRHPSKLWGTFSRYRWLLFSVSTMLVVCMSQLDGLPKWVQALDFFLLSASFSVVIFQTAVGFPGMCGAILSSATLRYVGRISYGLYVFHNFASIPTREILRAIPALKLIPGNFMLCNLVVTLTVASLSWHILERPLNDLKKYFPYVRLAPLSSGSSETDSNAPPA